MAQKVHQLSEFSCPNQTVLLCGVTQPQSAWIVGARATSEYSRRSALLSVRYAPISRYERARYGWMRGGERGACRVARGLFLRTDKKRMRIVAGRAACIYGGANNGVFGGCVCCAECEWHSGLEWVLCQECVFESVSASFPKMSFQGCGREGVAWWARAVVDVN